MKNCLFAVLLLLGQIVFSKSVLSADDPLGLLRDLHFTILNDQPKDFTLNRLDGGELKLSELKGKWVMLVFWATWCGPCRGELPQLQAIHQKFKDKNLEIVAVSIDQGSKSAVDSFVKSNGLEFTVLHDPRGKAASIYQASAVPVIYAISPDWKLVGVSQGASSWDNDRVKGVVEKLLAFNKIEGDIDAQKLNAQKVELPNDLTPPLVKINWPKAYLVAGKSFDLEVMVSWEGDARQYSLKTPVLTLPDKVESGEVYSRSSSNATSSQLYYIFPLTVKEAGLFSIGPAELSFSPRMGGKELFSRAQAIKLKVNSRRYWPWLTILPFLVVGAAFFYWRKSVANRERRRRSQVKVEVDLQTMVENINQLKVTKGGMVYQKALLQFVYDHSGEIDPTEKDKILILLEEIAYAGRQLTASQLSYYERIINRFLKKQDDDMEA